MELPGYENNSEKIVFAYLMRFKDGNRIDLTLFPLNKLETHFVRDSLSVLLLDKDNIFGELPPASEADYLIRKPSEKEFADVCNEFWWVATYVAKGLRRNQIFYAKDHMENQVRRMFMKMIEWQVGTEKDFSVNPGASGKYLPRYVDAAFYAQVLQTYADAKVENIWKSLFIMAEIFNESAKTVALRLGFAYHAEESGNVVKYLEEVKNKGEN
jgi:aminoglycoside 6-adenylyltransferase